MSIFLQTKAFLQTVPFHQKQCLSELFKVYMFWPNNAAKWRLFAAKRPSTNNFELIKNEQAEHENKTTEKQKVHARTERRGGEVQKPTCFLARSGFLLLCWVKSVDWIWGAKGVDDKRNVRFDWVKIFVKSAFLVSSIEVVNFLNNYKDLYSFK